MAYKIGIFGLSKGSGKTVTCAYLSAALSVTGKKVLSVDFSGELGEYWGSALADGTVSQGGFSWEYQQSGLADLSDILNASRADYMLVDITESTGAYSSILKELDSVIIPVESEFYGLENLSKTLEEIQACEDLLIDGILMTKYNLNAGLSVNVKEALDTYFSPFVFESTISRNYYLGSTTFSWKNLSGEGFHTGFVDYLKLANEIIENEY